MTNLRCLFLLVTWCGLYFKAFLKKGLYLQCSLGSDSEKFLKRDLVDFVVNPVCYTKTSKHRVGGEPAAFTRKKHMDEQANLEKLNRRRFRRVQTRQMISLGTVGNDADACLISNSGVGEKIMCLQPETISNCQLMHTNTNKHSFWEVVLIEYHN